MRNNKVFYICFYAEQDNKDNYIIFPSAWNKVDYVVSRILTCGYDVDLLSASRAKKKGKYQKYEISKNEIHHYFSSTNYKGKIWNKIMQFWICLQIVLYVLVNYRDGDAVVVYHSLYYCTAINILKNIFRKKVILEVEEVYSHTDIGAVPRRAKEEKYIHNQDYLICINELVKDEFAKNKPCVIAYGDYRLCPDYNVKCENNKIKLVYAGVIEQQRKAAFIASDTMKHLSDNYELHIMGFGTKENVEALKQKVAETNEYCNRECVFYDGHFSGEDYFRKLQSNDIALSTHIYEASDTDSARYMFSSKILSYLNNNLPVVAQRLECLEKSEVGYLLNFYDEPKADLVATAVKSIDLEKEYDSRAIVNELDKRFVSDLASILEKI